MILSITFDDLCTCLILRGEKNNFVGFLRCSSTIQHSITNNNNFIYTCTYLYRGSTLKSFESLLCVITEVEFLMLDILCVLQKYGPLKYFTSVPTSQVQSLDSVFDSDTTFTYIYTVKHRQAQLIVSCLFIKSLCVFCTVRVINHAVIYTSGINT